MRARARRSFRSASMRASKRRPPRAGSLSMATAHWSTPPALKNSDSHTCASIRSRQRFPNSAHCSGTADFRTAAICRNPAAPSLPRCGRWHRARALRVLSFACNGSAGMKLLARADNALQASIWADTLRAAGIRCELRNTRVVGRTRRNSISRVRSAGLDRTRLRRAARTGNTAAA